jgi:hypothetical protein
MSIVLGLALEVWLVFLSGALDSHADARAALADAVQKISWSVSVCAGLTLGTATARSVRPVTMALLGALSAPAAFLVAKIIHRAVTQSLGLAASVGPSPLVVATIRTVEYGALGLVAGKLAIKPWAGIWTHAAVGLANGAVFGGALLAYVVAPAAASLSAAQIAGIAVNELLYPAGCAVILFSAQALGTQLARGS